MATQPLDRLGALSLPKQLDWFVAPLLAMTGIWLHYPNCSRRRTFERGSLVRIASADADETASLDACGASTVHAGKAARARGAIPPIETVSSIAETWLARLRSEVKAPRDG